ncbi:MULTISPECIES: hypothetical protein [Xanthomonas]|uniref:hypothetical protein n=1 Tax=Xanthomonas TaxID=338 RepID=UPI0012903CA2|nr:MULTISPECIES: hypothetical protein [Xanthomonas]
MHPFLATAALALLGATLPALAAEAPMAKFGRAAELYSETSSAGETLDAFVMRITPRARTASIGSSVVVCGEILCSGPYTLALKTYGRQDWCDVLKTTAPYVLVSGIAKDAREDHILAIYARRAGYLIRPWSIKFQDRTGMRRVVPIR